MSDRLRTLTLAQDYWYLESTDVISSSLDVIVKTEQGFYRTVAGVRVKVTEAI